MNLYLIAVSKNLIKKKNNIYHDDVICLQK